MRVEFELQFFHYNPNTHAESDQDSTRYWIRARRGASEKNPGYWSLWSLIPTDKVGLLYEILRGVQEALSLEPFVWEERKDSQDIEQ